MSPLQALGRAESISFQTRRRLIWRFRKIFKQKDGEFEVDFFGMKYKGTVKNFVDRHVYYFGAYEKKILNIIKKVLQESEEKIFIDIGANVGHHTLFASKFAKEVYAFEPYEKVRDQLKEKLKVNNVNNVKVIPCALGESNDELNFFEPPEKNVGIGSFVPGHRPGNTDKGLKLIVRNGTELLSELKLQKATLIKCDTEGFEPFVLQGLLPFLKEQKPILIIEFMETTEKTFSEKSDLKNFLRSTYDMIYFSDSNDTDEEGKKWDFDAFGDVVMYPKQA